MGIKREVIEKVGLFNTELGRTGNNLLAGEEKDLFNRIREAGYEILYFPNIGVKHCIPGRRTTREFVERLAYGVGVSERLRTCHKGVSKYLMRIIMESIKWVGTIVLWFYYALQGKLPKGNILVIFRYHVTKGLMR
jgi:GT2 family glycosyltransferase